LAAQLEKLSKNLETALEIAGEGSELLRKFFHPRNHFIES